MTAHTHTTLVDGCYRCELNKDEIEDAEEYFIWGADGVAHQEHQKAYVFAETDSVVPGHVLVSAQDSDEDYAGVYVTPAAARLLAEKLLEAADEAALEPTTTPPKELEEA